MYHYRCISQIFIREGVRCAVNPTTGRERELRLEPAPTRRRVLVVGGGPAGLEAARLAALRGHDVTLCEATDRLGGKLVYASKTYSPNADVLRWLVGQVASLPIDVQLNTRIDGTLVEQLEADVVIAALGGDWARPLLPGADSHYVYTVDELDGWLVRGEPLQGRRIVVLGGGRAGLGLADVASQQGHAVTVVEESMVFAPQIGLPGRWRLIHELRERGVSLTAQAVVQSVAGNEVRYLDRDGATQSIAADAVLVASSIQGRPSSIDALRSSAANVHAVGDCTGAGYIEGAMLDAATLVVTL
jgi:NADPH-dependent 2,4-dienoyl-CoA reductase/sulfur reductase-like enzyme